MLVRTSHWQCKPVLKEKIQVLQASTSSFQEKDKQVYLLQDLNAFCPITTAKMLGA